ncbi:hypothetical protein LuPra_03169 [Luteitalea pratensis]|uniref:Uncharacterized protein n=1 Tax=Luteitalea pratensis TaxID=1855912 RepID=A0A143PMX7_LUTPR|nr:hypothetical protein [Luteitalea pratensis]AMY09942.1 hypothetical protein LuPra_03169 [Luteitalea pratensis]
MKKLVIGCGLALVLAAIAASAGFYYFVYRPARTFVSSMSQLGEVAELDAKVTNTRPFTAPADDTLTEAQVRRFVAVQESLHARMGTRATELQAKYKALDERKESGSVALTELVGAYRDLFGVIAEAKRAQVDALNAQAFSLDEYAWVKFRFYEAAGVTVTGIDFREMAGKVKSGDLQALQDMVKDAGTAVAGATSPAASSGSGEAPTGNAGTPVVTDAPGVGIPDANKTLVAPFKDKAATWMIYGAFGL